MNDRAVSLLEQYEIEVTGTRKGRGAILCDTDKGTLIFKEYTGNPERLAVQDRLLRTIAKRGLVEAESLIPTKEGAFFVKDGDGVAYLLKTFREGRECNVKDAEECAMAVRLLAKLHLCIQDGLEEGPAMVLDEDGAKEQENAGLPAFDGEENGAKEQENAGLPAFDGEENGAKEQENAELPAFDGEENGAKEQKNAGLPAFDGEENGAKEQKNAELPAFEVAAEYEKRNRELRRIRKYLLGRSQKTWFEISLLGCFDAFYEQAKEATEGWLSYEAAAKRENRASYCHGDYQYHNIILDAKNWFLINFERCVRDDPVRDLHLLMRKLLEKSNWSISLGEKLLREYEKVRPLSAISRIDLYYRLSYPEKFWKIANFYYNSGKAWIPGKNLEKLEKLMAQEKEKKEFMEAVFRV